MTSSPQGGQRLRYRLPLLPLHKFPELSRRMKLSLAGPEFVMDTVDTGQPRNCPQISLEKTCLQWSFSLGFTTNLEFFKKLKICNSVGPALKASTSGVRRNEERKVSGSSAHMF